MWTLAWLHLFGIGFDIYICCPYYYCWQYFYMLCILHIYAVNTTTTSLKSAGISEVNSVPSPSCTVQGTFTSNIANAIFSSEHWIAKDLLSFIFEEWIGTECITFLLFCVQRQHCLKLLQWQAQWLWWSLQLQQLLLLQHILQLQPTVLI